MRHQPSDWLNYSQKEKEKFYCKSHEERKEIILNSYLNMITDDKGQLDKFKLLEIILNLEDEVDDLKLMI